MPSLREIVQARAKVPAKIHDMEAGIAKANGAGHVGGPTIVSYAAAQAVAAEPDTAPVPRPPRAPVSVSPGGGSGSGAPIRKASEGRRPRPGSEPGRRIPSEPPRCRGNADAGSEAASDGRPAPRAKARASSVRAPERVRIGDKAPPVDPKNLGKVPAYLRRRNEEMAEDKRRAERPHSPQAPGGFRKVPESEKQATVEVLKQRKREVEVAQRSLPFKIETMGQKQREKELTERLAHLDKLLGMFSQPVVFIPADAEPIAASVPPLKAELAGRPPRSRDDAPYEQGAGGSEASSQARPEPRGRNSGEALEVCGGRPSSREARPASRENRARMAEELRGQARQAAPWERENGGKGSANIRTGVQVSAPPGGKSSLSLQWD